MPQTNIKGTPQGQFNNPPLGFYGYGFLDDGTPVKINPDSTTTPLSLSENSPENIIANLGVDVVANLPDVATVNVGDVYVTSDTYKIYTAKDSVSWSVVDLVKSQFVTDTVSNTLYQFDGVSLEIFGVDTFYVHVDNKEDFLSAIAANGNYSITIEEWFNVTDTAIAVGTGTKKISGGRECYFSASSIDFQGSGSSATLFFTNNVFFTQSATLTNTAGNGSVNLYVTSISSDSQITLENISTSGFLNIYYGILDNITITPNNTFEENSRFFPIKEKGLMKLLSNPTDAQQTEMLTVDENGQAVGSGNHNVETWEELKPILALNGNLRINILERGIIIPIDESFPTGIGTKTITGAGIITFSGGQYDITTTTGENNYIIFESKIVLGNNTILNHETGAALIIYCDFIEGQNFQLTTEDNVFFRYANEKNTDFSSVGAGLIKQSDTFFKINDTLATTGTTIDFTQPYVFNTPSSPATENITFAQTGAKIGVVQKIYHNSGTEPTFSGVTNVVRTSGVYKTGQLNRIYAEWVSADRVEYRIENEASGWWHEWNIDEGKTTGKGYIDDTGNFTINLKLSYDNIDITQETFDLFPGVSGVCYVESVWDVVTKANAAGSGEVFADWRINNIIPYGDLRDGGSQIIGYYDLIRAGSNGTYDDYDTNDGFLWVGQHFAYLNTRDYPTYESYSVNPFPEASTLSFIANYDNSDGIREITIRGVISDKTKI